MFVVLAQELQQPQERLDLLEEWQETTDVTIEDMGSKVEDIEVDLGVCQADVDEFKAQIESLESQVDSLSCQVDSLARTCEILVMCSPTQTRRYSITLQEIKILTFAVVIVAALAVWRK